jgi:hypothetical protein
MSRKKPRKRKHKAMGMEAIAEPGVGALYVRGAWMKKLDDMGKHKRKQIKKSHIKRGH